MHLSECKERFQIEESKRKQNQIESSSGSQVAQGVAGTGRRPWGLGFDVQVR